MMKPSRPTQRTLGLNDKLPFTGGGFLPAFRLKREAVPDFGRYPFNMPAIRTLDRIELHPAVTFFVGKWQRQIHAARSACDQTALQRRGRQPEL